MAFTKATKKQKALRMCLFGVSGSGKTYSALRIASAFVSDGQRIAVIDTERSSASLYADTFDFDVQSLTDYSVDGYCGVLREAAEAGYAFVIIDSLSHAWEGKGGILEEVDNIKRRKGYRDSMRAWNDIKPEENRLWDAILDYPGSVIVTMRAKTAYEIEKDDKGKTHVEKLGMEPIQRANKEFDFDVVGRMEIDNTLIVVKTRCDALKRAGLVFPEPDGSVSGILKEWLSDGAPVQHDANAEIVNAHGKTALKHIKGMKMPTADMKRYLRVCHNVRAWADLDHNAAGEIVREMEARERCWHALHEAFQQINADSGVDPETMVEAFTAHLAELAIEHEGHPLHAPLDEWAAWLEGIRKQLSERATT